MSRTLYRLRLNNHHQGKSGNVLAGGVEARAFMGEIVLQGLNSRGERAAGCSLAIPVDQLDEVLMSLRSVAASIPGSGYDDTQDLPGEWPGTAPGA